MAQLQPGLAGLVVDVSHHDGGRDAPKTPEPLAGPEESRVPSPRRPRFRLKRRNLPQLSAPTQNFLASVAAADLPIPSIEEPEIAPLDLDMAMADPFVGINRYHDDEDMNLLGIRGRTFSPPKTPAPGVVPSLSPSRYPSWAIDSAFTSSAESSPDRECSSSRPSTSRSTRTSFSMVSGESQASDDAFYFGPRSDTPDGFGLALDEGAALDDGADGSRTIRPARPNSRKAPWTKAMSSHLWATYVLYLQDPKVTPFRIGKSCIPPHGVCVRVAREAKRSWKGARARARAAGRKDDKSGSTTPTGEGSAAFIEWPHTCAATRAHLRELCKLKAATPGARGPDFMSRSPTPFSQAANRHWNRRSTPARSSAAFGIRDMALSLAASTSEAMQPEGPLARLAKSASGPSSASASFSSDLADHRLPTCDGEASFAERRRLGSPFAARSYGPSSSTSLAAMLGPPNPQQSQTIGPRRNLQSPVRLSRSATQKRRTKQPLGPRKRPVLDSEVFTDPSVAASFASAAQETEFSSTSSKRHDDLFIPRTEAEPIMPQPVAAPELPTAHLAPPPAPPPRLGSPFSGGTSFSFPNRLTQPASLDAAALGRPFATAQRLPETARIPARTNLASRLAYIDQRLKEFNNRAQAPPRRPESPF